MPCIGGEFPQTRQRFGRAWLNLGDPDSLGGTRLQAGIVVALMPQAERTLSRRCTAHCASARIEGDSRWQMT
jgi:hypothetical protein